MDNLDYYLEIDHIFFYPLEQIEMIEVSMWNHLRSNSYYFISGIIHDCVFAIQAYLQYMESRSVGFEPTTSGKPLKYTSIPISLTA